METKHATMNDYGEIEDIDIAKLLVSGAMYIFDASSNYLSDRNIQHVNMLSSLDSEQKASLFWTFFSKLDKTIDININGLHEILMPEKLKSDIDEMHTLPSLSSKSLHQDFLTTESESTILISNGQGQVSLSLKKGSRDMTFFKSLLLKFCYYLKFASICDIFISLFDNRNETLTTKNSSFFQSKVNEKRKISIDIKDPNDSDLYLALEDLTFLLQKEKTLFSEHQKNILKHFVKQLQSSDSNKSCSKAKGRTFTPQPNSSQGTVMEWLV